MENNLFYGFTGKLLVKIVGVGDCLVRGRDHTIFAYVSRAYQKLVGEDRYKADAEKKVRNWELLGLRLGQKGEFIVEVRKIGAAA